MGVNIEFDMQAIKEFEDAVLKSAEVAMEQLISDAKNTVPLDQGALQEGMSVEVKKEDDVTHVYIDHDMLYSRYLYFGKVMVDPNTGSAWAGDRVKKVITDKKLTFKNGRTDHWFEPYIDGDKKHLVEKAFVEDYKRRTGV